MVPSRERNFPAQQGRLSGGLHFLQPGLKLTKIFFQLFILTGLLGAPNADISRRNTSQIKEETGEHLLLLLREIFDFWKKLIIAKDERAGGLIQAKQPAPK